MTEHVMLVRNNTRLTITPDAEPLNPRTDIQTPVGCYRPLTAYRPFDGPPAIYSHPGNLEDAHDRLWDYERSLDPEHLVTRWSQATFGIVMVHRSGAYWFCDRTTWDLLVGREWTAENQAEVIAHEIAAWERYRRNEAEVVTLERRATFKRISPSRVNEDDLLHVWEKVEDIGDVYVEDYGNSYIRVAADHFGHLFTKRERATMQAALDSERVLSDAR
jgi:uncharacterized protein YktA (UPF0223 family)